MSIDAAGVLAGIAVGGACGTAMAGAFRNRALSLWKEQAQALQAQNDTLRAKVDELTIAVAGMEGELRHLRALPDLGVIAKTQERILNVMEERLPNANARS